MNEPKNIYIEKGCIGIGQLAMTIKTDLHDEVYVNVKQLKLFIATEDEKHEFAGIVTIENLLEYLK